ncbi:MAG: UDP-N-acetylmuramoyl-L-alanyl-D-glutamate--2,6-diaminopimelate ligase [Desulfurivibrionaceae bacterium]
MTRKTGASAKILRELIVGADLEIVEGDPDLRIDGITADSRQAGPGKLFVAVKGERFDGHDFLAGVVEQGCRALVLERRELAADFRGRGLAVLAAGDSRRALAELAANFYGHPEKRLKLVGITGTNGKTTTSYLLESMIKAGGGEPGVIGTVNYRFRGREEEAPFTTPEPIVLYRMMREMVDGGVDHLIMEVSSHALSQQRLHGIYFDVAAFTNLSHEHLDFHAGMDDYFAAKSRLFTEHLKEDGIAVVMLADLVGTGDREQDWGERLAGRLLATAGFRRHGKAADGDSPLYPRLLLTCGRDRGDIHVAEAEISLDGIRAEIVGLGDDVIFQSPLVGDFNLLNMATAMGIGHVLGLHEKQIGRGLDDVTRVPGRLERVRGAAEGDGGRCRVFVDFAHTPDALSGVLRSVRDHCEGRLILVFGCGGDRDKGKRPLMGEIAGRLADLVIITTDNSRSEEPRRIMAEIEAGLRSSGTTLLPKKAPAELRVSGGRGYAIIESRRAAIRAAIDFADTEDVVLICGKGHETYQLVGNRKYFFDDRLEAAAHLAVPSGGGNGR